MNDNTATVIDAASGSVLATLPTGEGPHEVAASHDGRWALVSNYGVRGKPGNTITVIDVGKLAVARTIELQRLPTTARDGFLPGDSLRRRHVGDEQVDHSRRSSERRRGRSVCRPTGARTHMLGLSAKGDRLVTGNIADNTISVLSPIVRRTSAKVIPVARQPEGIAISPDGNFAWVGSNRDSVVLVVDTRAGVVIDTLRGFGLPYRLAISPDGRRPWSPIPMKATIRVFDATTRRQRFEIDVPRDSLVATAEVRDRRRRRVSIDLARQPLGVRDASGPQSRRDDRPRARHDRWLAPTGTWSDGIAYSPLVVKK